MGYGSEPYTTFSSLLNRMIFQGSKVRVNSEFRVRDEVWVVVQARVGFSVRYEIRDRGEVRVGAEIRDGGEVRGRVRCKVRGDVRSRVRIRDRGWV